jgi:hypothetical protein
MAPTGAAAAPLGAVAALAGISATPTGVVAALTGTVATLAGLLRKFMKAIRKTIATRANGMARLTTYGMARMTNPQHSRAMEPLTICIKDSRYRGFSLAGCPACCEADEFGKSRSAANARE